MGEQSTANNLTDDAISHMTAPELINSVLYTFDVEDELERVRLQSLMIVRAGELKAASTINRMISTYNRKDRAVSNEYKQQIAKESMPIRLKLDDKGTPVPTIDNFLEVMRNSPYYSGIRYNLMTNSPEIHTADSILPWADADESESRHYIETNYNIYSERKHIDAMRIFFREREYNPIQDLVNGLEWDGEERCERFLIDWAKADDTPYTREVSRLIFAGGINRLYNPGCKFDDVPVLIGTSQGEGKSTLVSWLAMHDKYFSEVTEMDGQKGIEQLEGAWICEIAELLALTKAKEQEAVKSYITRKKDKYRKPYDRQTVEYPRRCIFIGTTNNEQFLKDKTGNRRFYPVKVHSSGYWLYDHEQECRDYIIQCWAEARDKYMQGEMPNFSDRDLLDSFKAAQDEAMEDDWRVGVIEAFLDKQPEGAAVCIRQIMHEALSPNAEFPKDPTPKESQEIATIMSKFDGWEKTGRIRTDHYGQQRCWRKTVKTDNVGIDNLPF